MIPVKAQKRTKSAARTRTVHKTEFDKYSGVFIGDKGKFRTSSAYKSLQNHGELIEDDEGLLMSKDHGREPFIFVCKNGPGCTNHDWHHASPLHLIS